MNPLFQAAKESMTDEIGLAMGAMSLLFMAIFMGWSAWAYSPSNKARMEAWGTLPFHDDGE